MYGSVEGKGVDDVPLVGFKDGSHQVVIDNSFDPKFPFDERGTFEDDSFWKEVTDLYNSEDITRAKAQRIIRTQRLRKYVAGKSDLLVYLLTIIHDRYKEYCEENNKLELYPSFLFELAEFSRVILEHDFVSNKPPIYESLISLPEGSQKTVLHLVAERNLDQVAEEIISYHPTLVYVTTPDEDELPLHFALDNFNDDVSDVLIRSMRNGRVRELFEESDLEAARFKLCDFINHGEMKKTVMAILDCLINPDWPFIPINKKDESKEEAYSYLPNMPLRYHFYYRLLDGDDGGRPAKDENGIVNADFLHRNKSCLQLLTDSTCKEDAMRHPVVRLLVRRKWDAYGRNNMIKRALLYVVFLFAMSMAFFLHERTASGREYHSKTDYLRLFCEIVTLLFTLVYLISECVQVFKEKLNYFMDPFNYFDILGMALLIAIIPVRFSGAKEAEWAMAAAAFMLNFLRIFKYFSASRTLGLYTKTFAKIIYYDILKFSLVFFVVMFAFTGGCYLALKASHELSNVGGFWSVLLKEVRALTEAQGFEDSYTEYNVAMVIFLMVNMFTILVVLTNVLIGQISYRYEEALTNATIQYDIDKTKIIAKIESSWFRTFNARIAHYIEGDFISEQYVEEELLEDWVQLKKNSTAYKRDRTAIRSMMKSKIKKVPEVTEDKIEDVD